MNLKDIKITDRFWSGKIELIRNEVIPYQWEILNDRVPGAAPSYCMHNFRAAAELNRRKKEGRDYTEPVYTFRGFETLPEDPSDPKEDEFYGFVFQDSDFYKWIEAVGYSLMTKPDPILEKTADEAIDIVCSAQADDGYLDTYYIINGRDRCFTNLRDHHELYCLGHLIEGAIAYFEATGKDKLLIAARRYADHVFERIGPEKDKIHGYPGHEIAEMALFKLYRTTGDIRYLKLSEYFIDERGKEPLYFYLEHPETDASSDPFKYYHQSHLPVRYQDEAVGHAVRAVYLYSAMADLAHHNNDEELKSACERLWDSITSEKMYITGGIGATHIGESFSFPYDLPNDTAYAETCASIGLVFFARRMLEIRPDRKFSDVMELALFNGILSGIAVDGKSFFYVNPLEVIPEACHKDGRKAHVKPVRQKWFGCACCPPNLARLIQSIGKYAFSETEDTLFIHLFMGAELKKNGVDIRIDSNMPGSGKVTIKTNNPGNSLTIAVRIPSWCTCPSISGSDPFKTENGYMYFDIPHSTSTITIDLPMIPGFVCADPRVTEDKGKVAVIRGPVVYCAEEADNGPSLASLHVDTSVIPEEEISDEPESETVFLRVHGKKVTDSREGSDYVSKLYKTFSGTIEEEKDIRLIPYRLWANRGEGEMRVFLNV